MLSKLTLLRGQKFAVLSASQSDGFSKQSDTDSEVFLAHTLCIQCQQLYEIVRTQSHAIHHVKRSRGTMSNSNAFLQMEMDHISFANTC